MQDLLKVCFTCNIVGDIKGRLFKDTGDGVTISRANKLVLIYGYSADKRDVWVSELPQAGFDEWWLCEEVRDTKPEDPAKGVILVRLRHKLAFADEVIADEFILEQEAASDQDQTADYSLNSQNGCQTNPNSLFEMLRKRAE